MDTVDDRQPDPADESTTTTVQDVAAQRRLADFLPGGPADNPTVTLDSHHLDVVILEAVSSELIKVTPPLHDSTGTAVISAHTTATAITDPQRQNALLRQALATLSAEHTASSTRHGERLRAHERTLEEIRAYAVERHRSGDICRDGLDKFLSHFDMDPYCPRLRISFTITGSYEIDHDDRHAADADARDHLRVNFDNIDHYEHDSDDYHVSIEATDVIDDD